MNRRNFLKVVTGFVAGVFLSKAKAEPQLTVATLIKCRDELDAKKISDDFFTPSYYMPCVDNDGNLTDNLDYDNVWRFYVNDKEVDGSRVVDEYGALCWPFQGAKKGDLCMAKSPTLSFRIA